MLPDAPRVGDHIERPMRRKKKHSEEQCLPSSSDSEGSPLKVKVKSVAATPRKVLKPSYQSNKSSGSVQSQTSKKSKSIKKHHSLKRSKRIVCLPKSEVDGTDVLLQQPESPNRLKSSKSPKPESEPSDSQTTKAEGPPAVAEPSKPEDEATDLISVFQS